MFTLVLISLRFSGRAGLNQEVPAILVIDDDGEIQAIIEDALTDAGFYPAIAPSGEEAVTLLQADPDKYRALVTDISLRGRIDGWEVARHARAINPEFPVVYISGASGGGGAEQYHAPKAVCASAACHRDFPASQIGRTLS